MPSADNVTGWKNHFRRTRRWRDRALSELMDLPRTDFHDAIDYSLAYFVWSHSLRDWLIGDGVAKKDDLDRILSVYDEWKIARDLANRTRHFKITRSPTDPYWAVSREYDSMSANVERHHINLYFNKKKANLANIVCRTSDMWDEVLQKLGLSTVT
ncbi:hypothetical protein FDP22_09495 [Paroceanicella profunda]|uniref:Uncharacterized protein n=1 Tax=Paroceanicella profunda TaxID=2579971 RepID=A0A5B8FHG8_9RHOB|nr:hypothetical protein [Paroceanicella profunda]QDL91988.1 hypothetical protein FDP22_09495 [Paroceanicella profunda]